MEGTTTARVDTVLLVEVGVVLDYINIYELDQTLSFQDT